jgi:hypothetical protein
MGLTIKPAMSPVRLAKTFALSIVPKFLISNRGLRSNSCLIDKSKRGETASPLWSRMERLRFDTCSGDWPRLIGAWFIQAKCITIVSGIFRVEGCCPSIWIYKASGE